MKKKIFLIGMSTLLLCGCGKIPTLSNGDEAVVEFKGGHMISANELYDQIKSSYGLNTLVNMIDTYIFETELKDEVKESKEYAEAVVKQLQDSYDSESDILSMLSMYGYNSVDAYQQAVYLNYLQNKGIEKYVSDNLTEDELKDYYDNSVYPNMTISHILVTPDVASGATSDEQTEKEDEAKDTINKIIKELKDAKKNGKDITETFTNLAKEYSDDEGTKDKGGDLGEINIGSLDSKYDELVKAAAELNDGEFSTELITTEAGYHVILKTKTGKKDSYEDALDSIKETLTNNKLSDDAELSVEALKYYRDLYDLNITDSDLKSQYGTYMNNLINNAKQQNNNKTS